MKGKNDGVENEKQIVEAIHKQKIKRLTEHPRRFIDELFQNVNDNSIILAKKVGGQGYKPDVEIEIDNTEVV